MYIYTYKQNVTTLKLDVYSTAVWSNDCKKLLLKQEVFVFYQYIMCEYCIKLSQPCTRSVILQEYIQILR